MRAIPTIPNRTRPHAQTTLVRIILFNGEGQAKDEREDVQEGKKAGNPNAKKARIPPSLLRYDRLMQDCLSPAHGLHTVIKPDPMTWGYPSEVAGYILLAQQQNLPHPRGMVRERIP